jgi:hypothetical protein
MMHRLVIAQLWVKTESSSSIFSSAGSTWGNNFLVKRQVAEQHGRVHARQQGLFGLQ